MIGAQHGRAGSETETELYGFSPKIEAVVSKLTGFQDLEPGVGFGWFGAETWAGHCLPPSFLSSSPAKNRASEGLAVKE
jgi:hypothetical protein